ncbi:MAG: hypothetical protein V3T70_08500 [Phycisphaerae bacterium]
MLFVRKIACSVGRSLLRTDDAVAATEYAILLAVIIVASLVVIQTMALSISQAWNMIYATIDVAVDGGS